MCQGKPLCRASLDWLGGGWGGPTQLPLRGTYALYVTLGLPPLRVSVCGYFERGGSGRTSQLHSPLFFTTSCPLEGR